MQIIACAGVTLVAAGVACGSFLDEWKSGINWNEPVKIDPGDEQPPAPVPSDAIVLFGGDNLDAWSSNGGDAGWEINGDGSATVKGGSITTRQSFDDVQLHVEFKTPEGETSTGQGKGNSGVFLMNAFEVQVLDSFENETYFDGQAGAIYKQSPPLVNASLPPGTWQQYDIVFEAPHFDDDGNLEEPAYITVFHNGVLVQNRYAIQGGTHYDRPPAYDSADETGPISIQDHSNPVQYRNIWVRELKLGDDDRIGQ